MVFLDIKSAYDSVDRDLLFQKLASRNVDKAIVEIVRQMFHYNTAFVSMDGCHSTSFKMPAGVQQGSVISPLLYSVFIDDLVNDLRLGPGISYDYFQKMNCLLYADNIALIALIAKDVKEINCLLRIADSHSKKNNYLFNHLKSVVLGSKLSNPVALDRIMLKHSTYFSYLGILFSHRGIDGKEHCIELKHRVQSTTNYFKSIGLSASGFELKTKITIYKTFIRSRIEYGLAILNQRISELKSLEHCQYTALCGMFSVSNKTSRKTLRLITGICSMELRAKILKARFLVKYITNEDNPRLLLPKITKFMKYSLKTPCSIDLFRSQDKLLVSIRRPGDWESFEKTVEQNIKSEFQEVLNSVKYFASSEIGAADPFSF